MQEIVRRLLKPIAGRVLPGPAQMWVRRMYMSRQIAAGRHFRESELALVRNLLRPGDQVADVGANVGIFTRELSQAIGTSGRMYSFEPVSANFDVLSDVVRRCGLTNVQIFRKAIGAANGTVQIVVPEMKGFEGLYWAHVASDGEPGKKEPVELCSLDDLHRQGTITALDFIKCDVEGGEAEVVKGAANLMRTCRPGWLIEISRQTSSLVFETMTNAGYKVFVHDGGLAPVTSYRDGEYSNYMFFHPESKLWSRAQEHIRSISTAASA